MRLAAAVGLIGSGIVLSGCAGIRGNLREPEIRLDRVIVRGLGLTGGTLDLVIGVDNPNGFDLRGTALQLGFDVEGSHVGDVRYTDDYQVSRNGETLLTLPLRFEWAGAGAALRSALGQGDIPYTMKGLATLQTPFGPYEVPFTREGRVPLTRSGGRTPIPTGP